MNPDKRVETLHLLNRAVHDQALALFLLDGVDFTGVGPKVKRGDVPSRYIRWDTFEKK